MPPDSPRTFLFLNQLRISSAEKNTLEKMCKLCPPPRLKFLATPPPSLVVDEEILVIGLAPPPPPHCRNASAIAALAPNSIFC